MSGRRGLLALAVIAFGSPRHATWVRASSGDEGFYKPDDVAATCVRWDEDLSARVDLQRFEYDPQPNKVDAPLHLVGPSRRRRAAALAADQEAYLRSNPFPAVLDDPAYLFRPDMYVGLANVTHRFVYFKPTKTAGTSIWRGWLEPTLCPTSFPGACSDG